MPLVHPGLRDGHFPVFNDPSHDARPFKGNGDPLDPVALTPQGLDALVPVGPLHPEGAAFHVLEIQQGRQEFPMELFSVELLGECLHTLKEFRVMVVSLRFLLLPGNALGRSPPPQRNSSIENHSRRRGCGGEK